MPRVALLSTSLLAFVALGCEPEPVVDLCEEAALYQESCTGTYVTPPPCDDAAAAQAERMLAGSCDQLEGLRAADGKADGAFCDWFGLGCHADEAIFEGPQCSRAADCSGDRSCIEGRCTAGASSDEIARQLDRLTSTTEVSGDDIRVLLDNGETRDLRDRLFTQAQHSIHFTSLSVSNARVSREMVAQFADAVRRGVEVRVVVDAVAQGRFSGYDILEAMVDAGVEVLVFNPIREWAGVRLGVRGLTINNRLHEKMIVVDGEDAIVGGRNTGFSYLTPGRIYDIDVHVRGPGVGEIQRMFLELWDQNGSFEREAGCPGKAEYGFFCPPERSRLADDAAYYPSLAGQGGARTRTIHSEPYKQSPSHGYVTYVSLVRSARESITIAAGYFIPPRRLLNHLRAAAERGVEVRVIKNSKESTLYEFMYYASLNFYRELLGAGVDIREYQGSSMMHAKTMVVDGQIAVVGSYNLSPRSAMSNSEALFLIRDDPSVAAIQRALDAELAAARPASADIGFRDRLKARAHRAVEWLF